MTDLNSKCSVPPSNSLVYVSDPWRAFWADTLHLELRSVTCNGAEENQAHRCDPYDVRVQEQPLFLTQNKDTQIDKILMRILHTEDLNSHFGIRDFFPNFSQTNFQTDKIGYV